MELTIYIVDKTKLHRLKAEGMKAMGKKKKNDITIRSSAAEYLTFVASTGDDQDSVEMRYEDENIWLTQKMMATLYDVETHTINYHIKRIFADSELEESSVIRNFRITAADAKNYNTNHYNLQAIIAVGFKVNNERAVQFRKWANQIVKDYTIQGWVMDEERLKHGGTILTQEYFAKVQNKLHFAVHGNTAAEVIYNRADAQKKHMGLTTWNDASLLFNHFLSHFLQFIISIIFQVFLKCQQCMKSATISYT